jgi:hypothetical protein
MLCHWKADFIPSNHEVILAVESSDACHKRHHKTSTDVSAQKMPTANRVGSDIKKQFDKNAAQKNPILNKI